MVVRQYSWSEVDVVWGHCQFYGIRRRRAHVRSNVSFIAISEQMSMTGLNVVATPHNRRFPAHLASALTGAGVGVGLTFTTKYFFDKFANGESVFGNLCALVYSATLRPARQLCTLFGLHWPFGGYSGSWQSVTFVALTNALLLAVAGLLLVLIYRTAIDRRDE
jgi:hypothetical protein